MDDEEIPAIIPVDIQLYQATYTSPPQPTYNKPAASEQPKRLSNSALSGKPSVSSAVPASTKIAARHSLPAPVQHKTAPQKSVIALKRPLHPIAKVAKLNDKEPVKRIGSKVFQVLQSFQNFENMCFIFLFYRYTTQPSRSSRPIVRQLRRNALSYRCRKLTLRQIRNLQWIR